MPPPSLAREEAAVAARRKALPSAPSSGAVGAALAGSGQLAKSKFLMGDSVSLDVELPEPGCFTLVPKPVLHGRGRAEPLRVTVTVECTDLRSTVLGVSRARQGGGLS